MGIRIGLQFSVATGYPSAIHPFAGVGMGLQLSERCRWMIQADDLNAFMMKDEGMRYRLRTGLGFQFSPICMLALESLVVQGEAPSVLASIHYRVTDEVFTRIGFVSASSLVNISAGFNMKGLQLEFYSGWQVSLGLSAGLSIACSLKAGKP